MRQAKSYSIVDHRLLHGGFLARLTHRALALYLFLCVVGDLDGRSFYSDQSVCKILRFSFTETISARSELIRAGLIDYRSPYWWVKSLSHPAKTLSTHFPAPSGRSRKITHCDSRKTHNDLTPIRGIVPDGLKTLLQSLNKGGQ